MIDVYTVVFFKTPLQNFQGQRILNVALDGALHGPGAVDGVETLADDKVERGRAHLKFKPPVGEALREQFKLQLDDTPELSDFQASRAARLQIPEVLPAVLPELVELLARIGPEVLRNARPGSFDDYLAHPDPAQFHARVLLEVHCLHWPPSLGPDEGYGRVLRVELLHKLHDERRYPSLQALREGIARDTADARAWWRERRG